MPAAVGPAHALAATVIDLGFERRALVMWWAVTVAALGCYAVKFVGLSIPERVLDRPAVRSIAALLPVALLAALASTGTVADGTVLTIDARLAGLGVAVIALLLRAPFLVVVVVAAAAAAVVRALG